jgi:hypothetical protein
LQTKLKEILELQLADNTKAWLMRPDGSYVRNQRNEKPAFRFQERFYEMLKAEENSFSKGIGAPAWHNCQTDEDPYMLNVGDFD